MKEIPGPATSPHGDFALLPQAIYDVPPEGGDFNGNLAHKPKAGFMPVSITNTLPAGDHVAGAYSGYVRDHYSEITGLYVPELRPAFGGFTWVIPSHYKKQGSEGEGTEYCKTLQVYTWTFSGVIPDGTASITKGDCLADTAP